MSSDQEQPESTQTVDPATLPDTWGKSDDELTAAAALMPAIPEGREDLVGEDDADPDEREPADSPWNLPEGVDDDQLGVLGRDAQPPAAGDEVSPT